MTNKTISEILLSCKVGDVLVNEEKKFKWTVTSDSIEEGERVVIAIPDKENSDRFELWSSGVESHSVMLSLKKVD